MSRLIGYIDKVEIEPFYLHIEGWALVEQVIDGEKFYTLPSCLRVKLENLSYEIEINKVRFDVAEFLGLEHLERCGFDVFIPLKNGIKFEELKHISIADACCAAGEIGYNFYQLPGIDKNNGLYSFDYEYFPRNNYPPDRPNVFLHKLISREIDLYTGIYSKFKRFLPFFERIPNKYNHENSSSPYWHNDFFSGLDAISLYSFMALTNPEIYCEIGSGNSTKFARRAISDHGLKTKIVSIDPFPRAEVNEICDVCYKCRCEEMAHTFFDFLPENSLMFVDNSHRAFQNSDVTFFFLEILPRIMHKNILLCLHDIFLPYDYPDQWIFEKRFYNEQYLLASFLLGNGGENILLPVYYCQIQSDSEGLKNSLIPFSNYNRQSASFWMKMK